MQKHIPVLLKEVIEFLQPQKNQNFIDATLGMGGYSREILLNTEPKGALLGIDCDKESLALASQNLAEFKNRCKLALGNFNNLSEIIQKNNFKNISGIVFDLGISSVQLSEKEYGLTFAQDAPLNMSLSGEGYNAEDIINSCSQDNLADILYKNGNIFASRKFAKKIVEYRRKKRIITTFDLINAIGIKNPKILAPIFQSFRIEVNQEFKNLINVLPQAFNAVDVGGRVVIISYHSGEDRIVKNFLKLNTKNIKIITKKPITPTLEEIKNNPRSRSAKLRVGERLC